MAAMGTRADQTLAGWPTESREAAELVVKTHGDPDEATESELVWHDAGPWKRIVAQKAFWQHDFPTPHTDSVESVIDYHVPVEKIGMLAEFDGSVMVERTTGELSARCHDEQANMLALNLVDDIVTGKKTVDDARRYYAKEFLDYRRKRPTPYMSELKVKSGPIATTDPDTAVLSEADLQRASEEGKRQAA